MRFAHISDLHLCRDPQATPGVRDDITGMVEAIAEDLDRISDILDFIVLSGDLTDDAHPESFRTFVRIFESLPCPVFVVPGNHDGPAAFHASKSTLSYLSDSDISGRLVQVGSLRVLGLDTCIEGETTGALSTGDLALLEKELSVDSSGPLVIVMHHAPFDTGHSAFDAISRLEGSADFSRLLEASWAKPIVLCGHIHRPYYAMWHGAACFVAGTPAAPFMSDLPFGDTPIYPEETQYSYFVHSLDTAGHHVVTPRSLSFGRHSGGELERRR
jgi:3',5'-cyclic AMP phosphodiesterase CpdA